MTNFNVAGLQMALPNGDNRAAIAIEIANTMQRFPWVQMIILPELVTYGPDKKHAQSMPGEAERGYQELAAKHGIWLIPGSLYEQTSDGIYNTTSVINPQGAVIARYRKIYPFQPYESGVLSGNQFIVFEVPDVGKFGVSICYDMWFPETIRALVWHGAEVIIHPTMTGTIDRGRELVMAQANAIFNQCYFLDVNNAGELGNGRSIYVGPEGDVLHQSAEQTEVVPLTLDLDRVRETRRSGTLGLGQVLKSFRDTPLQYPCYNQPHGESAALASLGPLQMQSRSLTLEPAPPSGTQWPPRV